MKLHCTRLAFVVATTAGLMMTLAQAQETQNNQNNQNNGQSNEQNAGGQVLIVGSNPSIDHRAKPNGGMGDPTVTSANFWRVTWSPAGPGAACFITVNDPEPNAQKFVITDNPELAKYISSKQILGRLLPNWNTPEFKIIKGTVTQTANGNKSLVETCKGGDYTVDLKWTDGLGNPRWIDFPFARQFGVIMTLVGVSSGKQEIVINGKRAPGQYASGFLSLNETWRLEGSK